MKKILHTYVKFDDQKKRMNPGVSLRTYGSIKIGAISGICHGKSIPIEIKIN